ncbi:MAG: acyltransferase [Clostridia bacterium]|nr:acyltransferase [Clostridia bacterium]
MKRISGITYLKAFLPLCVIACHIKPFGDSAYSFVPLPSIPGLKDVFYSNVFSLAVPLFFIISIFLYLMKRDRTENHLKLCIKRVCYLLGVFAIVRIIYILFGIGNLWIPDRGLFKNSYAILFGGGDTLLYYLELCAYLIVFTELCCVFIEKTEINKKAFSAIGLGLSLLLICIFYFVSDPTVKTEALRFYSPICFPSYVFIAFYFKEAQERNSLPLMISLFVSGMAFAVFEWAYLPNAVFIERGYSIAFPFYARISVVLLSMSIFGLMLKIGRSPSKFIEYLASLSLYAYCVHQIFINLIATSIKKPFLGFLTVVALSYFASAIIKTVLTLIKKRLASR